MKPAPFAYVDPATTSEALEALARYGDEGKVLAGGQSLVPLLNMRLAQPRVLVDLNRITALRYIRPETRDDVPGLALGAMTRQRSIEDAADVHAALPLLREAIIHVGHPPIRNRGTIGGSIAHADPAAELPLIFRLLDGIATVQSTRGEQQIRAADFFLYTFTPALEVDEMLTEVWLPLPAARSGQAFIEVARRHGDFALVAVGVEVTLSEDGTIAAARIAVGGAAQVPARATEAEDALRGSRPSLALFRDAGRMAGAEMEPTGDIHADGDYRREVAGELTFRALTRAWERIPRGDA